MKRFVALGIFVILSFVIQDNVLGASGTRVLKEIVAADQSVEAGPSAPVIISRKTNHVAITPKTVLIAAKASIQFTLAVSNRTGEPLEFSIKDIRIFSGEKGFPILDADRVAAEAREEFAEDYSRASEEQKKALQPFMEDIMQRARDQIIRGQTIAPAKKAMGLFAIEVPMGTKDLTVEVKTPKDTHTFNFQIIDL